MRRLFNKLAAWWRAIIDDIGEFCIAMADDDEPSEHGDGYYFDHDIGRYRDPEEPIDVVGDLHNYFHDEDDDGDLRGPR